MLKNILNRLKPQAEKIIAKEQAGFRAGRSTTEQKTGCKIICGAPTALAVKGYVKVRINKCINV